MNGARAPVDVAVGILIRPDGRFLLASRPPGKPYAGYWEFPGGKLEPGESVEHALTRELHEELGITIGAVRRWVVRVFDYPHARVRLHFCRVFDWDGELHARELQDYGFFAVDDLPHGPLLPATVPVLRWLSLPSIYAISAATLLGVGVFVDRLRDALDAGLRLLQLREPGMAADDFARLFAEVLPMVRAAGALLLVNSHHAPDYWQRADGVHLRAVDAARLDRRPVGKWVAASVHDRVELARAAELAADFVVAGPVNRTASHPHRAPLGWTRFEDLVHGASMPVYALGGLHAANLLTALQHGAHGVALLSAAWNPDQCWPSSDGVSSARSGAAPGIE
jgi:8-oxo-dGTP diphosphatase